MRPLFRFVVTNSSAQLSLPPGTTAIAIPDSHMNDYTVDLLVTLCIVVGAAIFMAVFALTTYFEHHLQNLSSIGSLSSAPNRGLTKSALKSLPKMRYKKIPNVGNQARCVICLTEFEDREKIRKLPGCDHMFHVRCIDMWLQTQPSCPSCRREVVVVPHFFKNGNEKDRLITN